MADNRLIFPFDTILVYPEADARGNPHPQANKITEYWADYLNRLTTGGGLDGDVSVTQLGIPVKY